MEQLRPQTPKPPFPYTEREASYENAKDGAVFGGTLTIPAGKGPHPAVVLLTGSGSQDRDETVFGHKPFLVIADQLSRNGLAVLRVDDRGVGKSKGDFKNATLELHATDAEAAIAWLKKQPEIDPKRIGLLGHSEGGIIAAMVGARSKDVAFLVSIAGPGVSGAELNPLQIEALLRAQGNGDAAVAAIVAEQKKIMKLVVDDAPDAEVEKAVRAAFAVAQSQVPEVKANRASGEIDKEMLFQLAALKTPWFRSFVKLDARQSWRKVRCPVLALIGSKDTQVPADVNLAEIGKALAAGGNKDVTTTKLAGLNHLLQTASTGLLEEYGTIEETMSPAALTLMTTWLRGRAKLPDK
jgi:pimeloyl-ACP methyl ester carboxylesterase